MDARGPQGGGWSVPSCPRSEAPLLSPVAIPCVGGGADGVDVTTTRFLLGMALLRKEEEVRKREDEEEELKRIRNQHCRVLRSSVRAGSGRQRGGECGEREGG